MTGKEKVVMPDDLQCSRTDGQQWRCGQKVLNGNTLCEIHFQERYNGRFKCAVPDSLKPDHEIGDQCLGKSPSKSMRIMKLRTKRHLSWGSNKMRLDSIRVFLKRRLENKKRKKMENENLCGASELEMPDEATVIEKSGTQILGDGIEGSSSVFSRRSFGSKNTKAKAISTTQQIIPYKKRFKGNVKRCHWCRNGDYMKMIKCLNCTKQFFCLNCIEQRSIDSLEIKSNCPVCQGDCSCRICSNDQSKTADHKIRLYLIYKLLPVLTQVNQEQRIELGIEVKTKGLNHVSKGDSLTQFSAANLVAALIEKISIEKGESKCSNCRISYLDYHRSCENCSYTLCLKCCGSLRSESSSPLALRNWEACSDGSIICPPENFGGCGNTLLQLKCIYPLCWITDLEAKAEELLLSYNLPKSFEDTSCTICHEVCTLPDLGEESLEHFQKHWRKGHPVIAQNVLRNTSPLKWDPIFMFSAYLAKCTEFTNQSRKDINCLDWCEVQFEDKRTIFGSLEGETYVNTKHETIKINAWVSSQLFKEHFPVHFAESLHALPLPEYVNPISGHLNLAANLTDEMLKPEIGPCIYIFYGGSGEPESLINLHYGPRDVVNILAYATNSQISKQQLRRIKKLVKNCRVKGSGHSEGTDESYESENDVGYEMEAENSSGARWDIFRREDVPKLVEYITRYSNEFVSTYGYSKQIIHTVLDQRFFLDAFHKRRLKEEFGVEPWTLDQFPGDAIIIPAGCPYQIKKLQSCVHIMMDFISPENASECIKLNDEIHALPIHHKASGKMFEVKKMALSGVSSAIEVIRDLTQTKIMNTRMELSALNPEDQYNVITSQRTRRTCTK